MIGSRIIEEIEQSSREEAPAKVAAFLRGIRNGPMDNGESADELVEKLLPPKIKRDARRVARRSPKVCGASARPARRCCTDPTSRATSTSARSAAITSASARASSIELLLDPEGQFEIGAEVVPVDPLKFKDSKALSRPSRGGEARIPGVRRDGRRAGRNQDRAGGYRLLRVRVPGRLDGLGGRRAFHPWREGRGRAASAFHLRDGFGRRGCRRACSR